MAYFMSQLSEQGTLSHVDSARHFQDLVKFDEKKN